MQAPVQTTVTRTRHALALAVAAALTLALIGPSVFAEEAPAAAPTGTAAADLQDLVRQPGHVAENSLIGRGFRLSNHDGIGDPNREHWSRGTDCIAITSDGSTVVSVTDAPGENCQ